MPVARIDDQTSVEYVVEGAPQPGVADLVLIHGTGGSAETNWRHLIDPISSGRRVIAPNLAGSGATADHGGRLELHELVEQVDAAAIHAGSDRYDIVGFSLGAVVAAQLAASKPERVRRLVLVAGWASSENSRVKLQFELWRKLHAADPASLASLVILTGYSAPFLAKRPRPVVERMVADTLATLAPGIDRQAELDQRIDLSLTLPLVKASTLVIGCREDQIVPVDLPRQLVAPIRWSDYHEISSGHLVIFEQPGELVAVCTRFFGRPDRRSTEQPIRGPERRERR